MSSTTMEYHPKELIKVILPELLAASPLQIMEGRLFLILFLSVQLFPLPREICPAFSETNEYHITLEEGKSSGQLVNWISI